MGLDMYLTKQVYVKNWDHYPADRKWDISVSQGGKPVKTPFSLTYLTYEVAYWRKANAIHKWFVDNCQEGEDNGQDAYVSSDQLKELLGVCKNVLATAKMAPDSVVRGHRYTEKGEEPILEDGQVILNADEIAELLPTEAGFFFGCTDYDDGYMDDIKDTITQLEVALADPLEGDFYYRASW
jgi:hypothetical protein